jgi:hypothetical protein
VALASAHYEIHLLRGDRWVIDAVLHVRDEALDLGRGIAARAEADGVRVVKECSSGAADMTSVQTVFEAIRPRPKTPRRRLVAAPQPAAYALPEVSTPERQLHVSRPTVLAAPPWWRSAAGISCLGAGACAVLVGVLSLLT